MAAWRMESVHVCSVIASLTAVLMDTKNRKAQTDQKQALDLNLESV